MSTRCPRCWKTRSPNTCDSGGSLLIAVGTSAGARSQIPIFGAHIVETRDYNRVPDRYMAVGSSDSSYPAVAKADGWAGREVLLCAQCRSGHGPRRGSRDRPPGRPDAAAAGETYRRGPRSPAHFRARQPHQRFPSASRLRPLHRADRALSGGQRTPGRRAPRGRFPRTPQCKGKGQGVEVTDPEGSARSRWARPLPRSRSSSPRPAITSCASPMAVRTWSPSIPIRRNRIST
jgi:hypothetical protein